MGAIVGAARAGVVVSGERTSTCPECDRPFRSEVVVGDRLLVVCMAGHKWETEAAHRNFGDRPDQYTLARRIQER